MGVNGIYGLSGSGLDIESLVKMGMMSKQNQYDKMYQTELKNTWVKEAYSDVHSKLTTFKNDLTTFKMQSNMSAMKASSSNNDVVSVTANGAAAAMNHKVEVTAVASNAYMMTNGTISRVDSTKQSSVILSDVMFKSIAEDPADSKKVIVTYGDNSTASFDKSEYAIDITLHDEDGADANTYNVHFSYEDLLNGKTLNDFASAFNKSGANIQGGYDTANDSFSLYNKTSGEKNIIGIKANDAQSAALLNTLKLSNYDAETNSLGPVENFTVGLETAKKGTNASAIIDGKAYSNLETNKLTVAGVTYTFNNKSVAGQTSTINVSQDTDKIKDYVQKFVDKYNELIDGLTSKLNEEKYSDYKPLTKSQEAEMKQDQIDKWNEKAKSGLLYHDNNIRGIVSALREAVYTPVQAVDSKYNSLSAIGITTSNSSGHLVFDESKLEKALAADPDCVYQLFASDQDSTYIAGSTNKNNKVTTAQLKEDYKNTGVANRLTNAMTTQLKKVEDYAGSSKETDDQSYLGKMITQMQNKMSSFQTQMKAYEKLLYKRYDAMEVALSKMGAQLNYVAGYNN